MERTVHIMLAGDGAQRFAASQGFAQHPTAMLTPASRTEFNRFLVARASAPPSARLGTLPPMNVEHRYAHAQPAPDARAIKEPMHDTVCILARDTAGSIASVCTTSGLGFKLAGRVGDSPIIGHGLYVDPQVGAVSATGNGELIMSVCGSFLAVEFMRQGRSPAEALSAVLSRIRQHHHLADAHQVALIALRADGAWTSAALRPGFRHCISTPAATTVEDCTNVLLP